MGQSGTPGRDLVLAMRWGQGTGDTVSYRQREEWEMKSELSFLPIKDWTVPTTPTGSVPIGEGRGDKVLVASALRE